MKIFLLKVNEVLEPAGTITKIVQMQVYKFGIGLTWCFTADIQLLWLALHPATFREISP